MVGCMGGESCPASQDAVRVIKWEMIFDAFPHGAITSSYFLHPTRCFDLSIEQ